ncbi:hypothetical protein [Streptomyces sp. NBC_01124]|uniref:hypothetical protein n=1 Tax=Streptomyces sp. NBC_01124 TaxID=2903753 RepID=UPI003865B004|nr:HEPN domain-containing protein [Streptomyces sp. NBC_01124]WSU05892.1 HEPN domain-containing protein [Streptomyces sp. NBC_01124]
MEDTSSFGLRQAVLTWLEQARELHSIPQNATDAALAARPEWEALSNAVALSAPMSDHRDLYGKITGDWLPRWPVILGQSGLGDATRLIAQGTAVPVEEVADSFVAFCTEPAPSVEDWLLLTGDLPPGTRIPLGRYTLQTFTVNELAQLGPMPALHGLQPGGLDFGLLDGAPFVHAPNPDRVPDRRGTHWFDFSGPRPEARHWRALLPLILWSDDLLHVDAVFKVERGRYFELNKNHVPTTLETYPDGHGYPQESETREAGGFCVTSADLPRMQAFCSAVTAKIDAVMDGATSGRKLPRKRARRLERAARHLQQAYQRTHSDNGVWEQEADELHLDYVIALEALMASPNDKHEGISKKIQTRTAALFPTPRLRELVQNAVQKAYSTRSKYVHGDLLIEQEESEKLAELRELRLIVRQAVLRWLILTPIDTEDLAPRLDAAADCASCKRAIDEPLRAFFQDAPSRDGIQA